MSLKPWQIGLLVFSAVLLVSRLSGGVGAAPPFAADKLCVLVIEQSESHGSYTADQLNVIQSTDAKSVKAAVESRGGEFQVIDADTSDNLADAPPWVPLAMAVKRDSLPWIVAAGPKSGFSAPLTTEADALERLKGVR
jgi:hypothetical protein